MDSKANKKLRVFVEILRVLDARKNNLEVLVLKKEQILRFFFKNQQKLGPLVDFFQKMT